MPQTFLGVGWGFPINVHREDQEGGNNQGKIQLAAFEESVQQAVWIILGTAKGERVMRPEFGCGIYDLVFELNSASTAGRISASRWSPAPGEPAKATYSSQ